MDRRQMVVQRVREFFGERVDDVLHMVRQDRQELRGWQEPAHVRAALRRSIRAEGEPSAAGQRHGADARVRVGVRPCGRRTGPRPAARGDGPDARSRRQRAGKNACATTSTTSRRRRYSAWNACCCCTAGRPCSSREGTLAAPPPFWNVLEDQREDIEMAQRGVGRIELLGHPEYDWAGTGFLVNDNVLMTTRRTAEIFIENRNGTWQFRPGITTWMDYRSPYQCVSSAGYRVRSVVGVHDRYDLALLEVERPQINGTAPTPLALAALPPPQTDDRPVYLIGYPVRDARRNEPEPIARIFRDVYNVKRVQPGLLRGSSSFHEVQLLRHDCAPLGQTAGSPLIDLETQQVLGLQTGGRYLETSTAIPLYMLRDDPLLRRAGVTFAEATTQERQNVTEQLERLARSRYWNEARAVIASLYQRAFGNFTPGTNR